jgi:hypothetical protein
MVRCSSTVEHRKVSGHTLVGPFETIRCPAQTNMKTESTSRIEMTMAATVAGEDLACGDYVSLLNETVEFPSFLWDSCGAGLSPQELVRLKVIPANAGHPHRVIAICLPFVYVRTPSGEIATIDARRTQLVRLDRKCAKAIWKELHSQAKQASRSPST